MISERELKVAIVGTGQMGRSIAEALLANGTTTLENLFLYDRSVQEIKLSDVTVTSRAALDDNISRVEIVILAVKPQSFTEVAINLDRYLGNHPTVVSIMAGISATAIAEALPSAGRVVRSMPNLAVAKKQSATGFFLLGEFELHEKEDLVRVLNSFGKSFLVEDETLLNPLTALSGSGPGYLYYFLDSLVKAGEELGFERKLSFELVAQMLKGAASIAEEGKSFKDLCEAVSSKGGTTEAGLKVFHDGGLDDLVCKAVRNANLRAEELGRG